MSEVFIDEINMIKEQFDVISDTEAVMLYLQHNLIPSLIAKYKLRFIYSLLNGENNLYNVAKQLFEGYRIDIPYKEENFSVDVIGKVLDIKAFMISYPTPTIETGCFCSLVFFDIDFERVSFFSVQAPPIGELEARLCSIELKENLKKSIVDTTKEDDTFMKAIGLHMKKHYT